MKRFRMFSPQNRRAGFIISVELLYVMILLMIGLIGGIAAVR
jgi:hypothetical protein